MTADEAKAFEHANIILQALGVQERVEVVLSQVSLRRGDVALLCSDGLHGPVSDEEILAVLIARAEPAEGGRRADPEGARPGRPRQHHRGAGPVRRRRADAAGARRRRVVRRLRPRRRPDPGAARIGDDHSLARETVEERLPRDMLTADDIPTKAEPDDPTPPPKHKEARTGRSLLALFLLALVAAATGGIFVMKCERDQGSKVSLP